MMNVSWNANQYLKYKNERTQPAIDLLARVDIENPKMIIDIGCGPGNSTNLLKCKFPKAKIIGADYSEDMLQKARQDYSDIEFIQCDASKDLPQYKGKFDLVFSNACIQWIPNHNKLISEIYDMLKPGGCFAIQQPMNYEEPIQKIIRQVVSSDKWSKKLNLRDIDILEKTEYYNLLCKTCDEFSMWEVVYYHSLNTHQDIIEWYRGTGMRPYLDQIDQNQQKEYESDVLSLTIENYKIQQNGKIIFPFPRLFFIGKRN